MTSKEVFTSLVRIRGSQNYKVVSVKSNKPIEKHFWIEFSKVLGRIYVSTPINIGDIVCKNVMNTGVDIVCTKKIE